MNTSILNDKDPLSDDEFQKFFIDPQESFDFNNDDVSEQWFANDALYPLANDTLSKYLEDPEKNCSEHLDILLEMNKYYSPSQIVVPVVYSIICLVGLIGNGLVMFVICGSSREMTKSVANIYIFNLAIADTLFLISLPFTSTQRVLLSWPFGAGMCKIVEAVKYLNYFASIFFLTAMSIDRCIAVRYVVNSTRWRTSKNTLCVCFVIWCISLVMVIPLLVFTEVHGDLCALVFNSYEADLMKDKTLEGREVEWLGLEYSDYNLDDYCKFLYSNDYINADYTSLGVYDNKYNPFNLTLDFAMEVKNGSVEDHQTVCKHPPSRTFHVFLVITFVIGFIIPFSIITLCYILIIVRLVRHSEKKTTSKQTERTRRKVTRMVVALVIAFFICWVPFYLWHLLQIRGVKANMGVCHNIRDFTFCLGYANSCLNPILYTFLGHNFRERLRKSIAKSLRSFSFATFTKYTTNHTVSRAEIGGVQNKKTAGANLEPNDNQNSHKISPLLVQVKEEDEIPSPPLSCYYSAEKLTERAKSVEEIV